MPWRTIDACPAKSAGANRRISRERTVVEAARKTVFWAGDRTQPLFGQQVASNRPAPARCLVRFGLGFAITPPEEVLAAL
jgi:hypothetical protein